MIPPGVQCQLDSFTSCGYTITVATQCLHRALSFSMGYVYMYCIRYTCTVLRTHVSTVYKVIKEPFYVAIQAGSHTAF